MSNVRYAGNYPDHVTRYNHKPNRWMQEYRPYRADIEWQNILIIAFSVATLIAFGVMILQAV